MIRLERAMLFSLHEFIVVTLFSGLLFNWEVKIHKTIILQVVLYDCETWSFTFMEECGLRVFENKILIRVFGPKRDENAEWRGTS